MRYQVQHQTTYVCLEPVSVGHNQAWLQPRSLPNQIVHEFDLDIDPIPSMRTERRDAFGNSMATFSFNEGYDKLIVKAVSDVEVQAIDTSNLNSPTAKQIGADLLAHVNEFDLHALQFVYSSPLVPTFPEALAYAQKSFTAKRSVRQAATELMQRIFEEFTFDPHATTVSTPVQQVLANRRGVCQDFAHVMLSMLRSVGVAARYVSGYLRTHPPAGSPRLIGADASHAWVSVYCGNELGWFDLDPTNNVHPSDEHITVAWGRDYADVTPVKGVIFTEAKSSTMKVSVDMAPLE